MMLKMIMFRYATSKKYKKLLSSGEENQFRASLLSLICSSLAARSLFYCVDESWPLSQFNEEAVTDLQLP